MTQRLYEFSFNCWLNKNLSKLNETELEVIDGVFVSKIEDDLLLINIKNSEFLQNRFFWGCDKRFKVISDCEIINETSSLFDNSNIIECNMPNLKKIMFKTFNNCINLEYINLENLININDNCFRNCKNLKTVILPKLKFDNNNVTNLFNNSGIEFYEFDETSTIIPSQCFYNCRNLKHFNFKNIKLIKTHSFANSGIENILIDNIDCNIENYAFMNCLNLKTVNITVKCEINDRVFNNSSVEEVNITNTEILNNACFYNCYNLKKVNIPRVKKLNNFVFTNCINLSSVNTDLENTICLNDVEFTNDFDNCKNIKYVNLNNCKYNINSFKDCNLKKIICDGINIPFCKTELYINYSKSTKDYDENDNKTKILYLPNTKRTMDNQIKNCRVLITLN